MENVENTEKTSIKKILEAIVQFLGEQDKAVKTALLANIGTAKTEAIDAAGLAADAKISTAKTEIQTACEASVAALRTELIGGASGELDTFKELADELNRLKEGGSSTPDALLQKITEIKNIVDGIKADLDGITFEGLQNAYRAAQA
ncbi:hypothetical protein [Neisseria cinerea]|uniref:hypothetical protein n=1 Tax=Neisseria cinerea TaxID=483 RepID=UPI0018CA0258|nr:hypothetical protein [Neisseria cinerea]MBG8808588.1 hypothetical protein [Neisseria meningitidis]